MSQAETEDVVAEEKVAVEVASIGQSGKSKEETREQVKLEERRQRMDEAAEEEADVTDKVKEGEPDVEAEAVELEEESEKEQVTERDVDDSVLLSEKERQNEEVNEKDNCSASSISSTSSTLEREEREVKLNREIEAGRVKTFCRFYLLTLMINYSYYLLFDRNCFYTFRPMDSVH